MDEVKIAKEMVYLTDLQLLQSLNWRASKN